MPSYSPSTGFHPGSYSSGFSGSNGACGSTYMTFIYLNGLGCVLGEVSDVVVVEDVEDLPLTWPTLSALRASSSLSFLCFYSSALIASSSSGSLRGDTSPAPSARLLCRPACLTSPGSYFPFPMGRGGLGALGFPVDTIEA